VLHQHCRVWRLIKVGVAGCLLLTAAVLPAFSFEPPSRDTQAIRQSTAVSPAQRRVTQVRPERVTVKPARPERVTVKPARPVRVTVKGGLNGGTFKIGSTITIAAKAPRRGMVFDRWEGPVADPYSATTTLTVPATAIMVTALYAKAGTLRDMAVQIENGSGSGTYRLGATITIAAAPAPAGQIFNRWTGDTSGLADPGSATTSFVVPSAPARLVATYIAANMAEVDITIRGGKGSGRYRPGAVLTVTADPAPAGQVFIGWTGAITGLTDPAAPTTALIVPATSATLVANYSKVGANDVEVTVIGGAGSGRYKPGTLVAIYPNFIGYTFERWIGPVQGPNDEFTLLRVPNQNVVITGVYKDRLGSFSFVTLTVKGGTGSGSHRPGTNVSIRANAAPAGQVFKSWSGDIAGIKSAQSASTEYRMGDSAATVEANYGAPIFRLTSHQDGDYISSDGETMFGQIESLEEIDRLAVKIGNDDRVVDISKTGGFAFRVFHESITPGQKVNVTVTAYLTDNSVSSYTYQFPAAVTKPGPLQQALGRITYGATPALLAALKTKSFTDFVREQLNPDPQDPSELSLKATYGDPFWTEINADSSFATEATDGLRLAYAAFSKWQLREVMARFWDNHFHTQMAESFHKAKQRDFEAYRANAFGSFKDLLMTSVTSPTMMLYLSNSTNSDTAINENYGRELLELHTVGLDGGYTVSDIRSVARILSGRTFKRTTSSSANTVDYVFDFVASRHADNAVFTLPFLGDRAVIGPNSRANGMKDGEALVDALAMHPSTQRFVCGKLIEYLVSDDRPQKFVDLCRARWARSSGNMKAILEDILTHPDYIGVAAYQRSKLKTPYEYAVGILRNYPFAFSTATADRPRKALKSFRDIWLNAGMDSLNYPVPTGFKETAADWNNSGSLTARLAAGTDKINGSRWPSDYAVQNFAGLLTSAPQPMLTAEAAAAYLLALGTADRFDRDEFDAVVAALKGSDGVFDPSVVVNGVSAEEASVRKAISLIITLPSYQIQ
jgi:uncharacterized protein (DUF1800 family)